MTNNPQTFDRDDLVSRLLGDEEVAKMILQEFLLDVPRQIATLSEAISRSDAVAARLHAHSIKGAAANVGANGIRETAAKLEQCAIAGDFHSAASVLTEVRASLECARLLMEHFCAD